MTKIISSMNHKGGCGKSELIRNLSALLAKRGKKVLIIDLDDQGSISESFGYDIEDLDMPCITDVLLPPARGEERTEQLTLDEVMCNVYEVLDEYNAKMSAINQELYGEALPPLKKYNEVLKNVWLVPCNITFDYASPSTLIPDGLKFALEDMQAEFDYIFLDCPPNLKIVTENAFLASDFMIVPVLTEAPNITGITRTREAMEGVAQVMRRPTADWKIVLNCVDETTIAHQIGIGDVLDEFGPERVYSTRIPASVKVGESLQLRETVTLAYPKNKVSLAYENLLEEIVNG